jgi:hypothetical protein
MDLKFVTGEPALLVGSTLFLADIHVGIEHEFRKSGLNMPSQTPKLLSRIESLLEKTRAKRLILIGDIKHKVPGISWQETREVPIFLQRLAEKTELHIIPGNHDGGIAEFIPKGVKLYPMQGALLGEIYASHGHTWPEPSFLQARYFLMSHSHPQVEFRDRLGYRWGERIWIRASLDKKKIQEKYPEAKRFPELVVMPAFNPLSGGIPVNRKRQPHDIEKRHMSPILKSARMRTARVYMLDGTYLGELGKL